MHPHAITLVPSDINHAIADEETPLFVLLSFSTEACSELLPTGFYTVEFEAGAPARRTTAWYRALNGRVVAALPALLRPAAEGVGTARVGLEIEVAGKGLLQGHVHKCCPPTEHDAIPMITYIFTTCAPED